jgi:predicted dehydrogenase
VIRIGHAGLGYWGPNLARNFGALADLRWLCDLSPELLDTAAKAHPQARTTADFQELLADPEVDAVVIATPVVTHYELAKQALSAGKHVFVEKPQAQSSAEAEELVALAQERGLVLMPGYLLLYHPALRRLKELIDGGEFGDVLYLYGNRQNLGQIRRDENALWSIGAQDLSMILHLVGEEPVEAWARGESFLRSGIEDVVFCYLRFPSGVVAHMHVSWLDPHKIRKLTVVGRDKMAVFDDMEPDRKLTVYDKGPVERPASDWQVRVGDIHIPKLPTEEPLRREVAYFLALVGGEGDPLVPAREGLAVIRTLEQLQDSLDRAPA